MLHATDDPSQIAPSLRCLGIPPPESTVMARAVAARAALRSYQPRLDGGATGGGGSRRSSAVERAFRTGLAALGSQGCMRADAAATPAVVLKAKAATVPFVLARARRWKSAGRGTPLCTLGVVVRMLACSL